MIIVAVATGLALEANGIAAIDRGLEHARRNRTTMEARQGIGLPGRIPKREEKVGTQHKEALTTTTVAKAPKEVAETPATMEGKRQMAGISVLQRRWNRQLRSLGLIPSNTRGAPRKSNGC